MAVSLAVKISGNIDPLLKSLRKAERSMNKFSRQMTRVGKTLTTSLTLPIAGLGFLAGKVFANFEQSMAKVKAVSGATGAEFKKLEKLALDLGASTRFTASEVAELQLNYSKLGFIPAEIQKITEATLDLALASGEDLATSATVAGATLRGFGLEASHMIRVTDVMAKSFSSSALNLEKFSVAMPKVAGAAKVMGFSLERTTSMLGLLIDRGIEASVAGTSLKRIFVELSKSGMTYQEAMNQINASTNKVKTATELFGDRAFVAAIQLAQNGVALDSLNTKLNDAKGSAKAMAAIMDATLQGALFRMKSAVEGMGIAFGEILAPTITKVAGGMAKLATWFKDLSPATKKLITIIAGLVAALGPLLFIIGKIPGILAAIISGMVGLISQVKKLALFIVANPWVVMGIAIAAATVLLIKYAIAAKTAKEKQIELNNVMNKARTERDKQLVAEFKALEANKELQDKFYNGWKDTWWRYVSEAKKAQKAGNIDLAQHLFVQADKTQELIEQLDNVRSAGAKVASPIVTGFGNITTATEKAATALDNYIAHMKMLQDGSFVGPMPFQGVGGGGGTIPGQGGGGLSGTITSGGGGGGGIPGGGGGGLSGTITAMTDLSDAITKVQDGFDTIADSVGGIFGKMKGMFNNIADFAVQAANKFKEGWKSAVSAVLSVVSEVMGMIGEIFNESHLRKLDELDEYQTREREAIQGSLLSEDEKAKAIAKLDKDSEKKRKAIAREQAKDAKTIAIIQAVIAGALAVVTALSMSPPPAGIILAIIVGALAAVQIAAIASQPLPALAEGGLAFAPTMAMVGDNPNAIIDPEVIAPLSKLKQFVGEGKPVAVYGILSGDDILLASERAADSRERLRGF